MYYLIIIISVIVVITARIPYNATTAVNSIMKKVKTKLTASKNYNVLRLFFMVNVTFDNVVIYFVPVILK
jgi:hypothetical protein